MRMENVHFWKTPIYGSKVLQVKSKIGLIRPIERSFPPVARPFIPIVPFSHSSRLNFTSETGSKHRIVSRSEDAVGPWHNIPTQDRKWGQKEKDVGENGQEGEE